MRAQKCFSILRFVVTNDDRLAAAERQARERVFVSHAVRQAQCVGECFVFACVVPEACSANGWTKPGGMDGDNAVITTRGIASD